VTGQKEVAVLAALGRPTVGGELRLGQTKVQRLVRQGGLHQQTLVWVRMPVSDVRVRRTHERHLVARRSGASRLPRCRFDLPG
jgi:hypothetical protein